MLFAFLFDNAFGEIMKNFQVILNDPCFIAQRIKYINERYFIVFNINKQKYEVHCLGQIGGTFCFTLPYDTLDERTLFYTLKTQSQNASEIIKELDKQNMLLQKQKIKHATNKIMEILS